MVLFDQLLNVDRSQDHLLSIHLFDTRAAAGFCPCVRLFFRWRPFKARQSSAVLSNLTHRDNSIFHQEGSLALVHGRILAQLPQLLT
jgi:hypothetical protein